MHGSDTLCFRQKIHAPIEQFNETIDGGLATDPQEVRQRLQQDFVHHTPDGTN